MRASEWFRVDSAEDFAALCAGRRRRLAGGARLRSAFGASGSARRCVALRFFMVRSYHCRRRRKTFRTDGIIRAMKTDLPFAALLDAAIVRGRRARAPPGARRKLVLELNPTPRSRPNTSS
jgi:hypothetical protein